MSLEPGTCLGAYEITAKLGEGGMGEVWRATDTRLGRGVALKLLPPDFAADSERLARFEREARILASLNHPNIATLYGLEHLDGRHVLVMELVEGEGLDEVIARGPVPVGEAVSIARQIAEALEAAHDAGIVHRDLKPANVRIRPDGTVKVLDFGLAKAWDAPTGDSGLSLSPTVTHHATAAGVLLGTAAYMSPEQARGKPVDKRADIWAFGAVLWEMLTGRPLFEGETVSDVLAAVLTREVDLDALPSSTPIGLLALMRRCLERQPKNRLRDIGEARIVLAEVARGEDDEPARSPGAAVEAPGEVRRWWRVLGWLLLGALAGLGVARQLRPVASAAPEYHVLSLEQGYIHSARFAPDGTTIVYGEVRDGAPVALYSTRSDATVSRPLDVPGADIVGITANGEMALILDRHHLGSWLRIGTLARAALAGGVPRALLDDVYDADITADGSAFAVVRADGTGQRLEYPVGTVLYRTDGWISAPRISGDGRRVAFADHPIAADDLGFVTVIEPGQVPQRISGSLNSLQGVAWSADGSEVLASYGSSLDGGYVASFGSDGARHVLLRTVTPVRVQDVARNGAILLTSDSYVVSVEGRLAQGEFTPASSPGAATIDGISDDGDIVVGTDVGRLVDGEFRVYYRHQAGPEIDLAAGWAIGVTPDGRWAFFATLSRDRNKLHAVPTGPGEPRLYDLGDIEPQVDSPLEPLTFTADGETGAFLGQRPGEGARAFIFDLAATELPRAATPEGVRLVRLSPDGKSLVAANADGILGRYSSESGERKEIPGAVAGDIPVAWSSASDAIFVWDQTIPARLERLDLTTGARTLVVEWKPTGSAQGLYGVLRASTDARYFLMRFRGAKSSLVVADGGR